MKAKRAEGERSIGRMLLADMKRAFSGWPVWGGALILFGALVLPVVADIFTGSNPASMNAIDRFALGLVATGAYFVAPVLCCLPMGISFCDDYITGFGRMIMQRAGIYRYLVSRILSAAFSGGFTMFLGMVLFMGFCLLVFTNSNDPNLEGTLEWYRSSGAYSWLPDGYAAGYWLMVAYGLQFFLWGAVWAVAGLVISALVVNRYASMALPYIFANALWFLFGRLSLYHFAPFSYLNPVSLFSSYWEVPMGLCIQMILFSSLFLWLGRRRLLYA
ncbi:MAG: hypothetical protein ACOX6S_00905 [Clostridia bacterium]|jgi:hypothetical protein